MSTITPKSYVIMRGRAYKCGHCSSLQPYVSERKRMQSHIYKDHIPLVKAAFHCKLCLFRSVEQEALEKHVLPGVYAPHGQKLAEYAKKGIYVNELEVLMKSNDPHVLVEGVDFVQLSIAESESEWRKRAKSTSSPAVPAIQPTFSSPPAVNRHVGDNIFDFLMADYNPTEPISPAISAISAVSTYNFSSGLNSVSRDALNTPPSYLPSRPVPVCVQTTDVIVPRVPEPSTSLLSSGPVYTSVPTILPVFTSLSDSSSLSVQPNSSSIVSCTGVSSSIPVSIATTITSTGRDSPYVPVPSSTATDVPDYIPSATNNLKSDDDIAKAIRKMTSTIADAIDKQTQQFAMLRATLTTFLRRMEDRMVDRQAPADRTKTPKRKRSPEKRINSVVCLPKKQKK